MFFFLKNIEQFILLFTEYLYRRIEQFSERKKKVVGNLIVKGVDSKILYNWYNLVGRVRATLKKQNGDNSETNQKPMFSNPYTTPCAFYLSVSFIVSV